jgi:Transposase DDE domain
VKLHLMLDHDGYLPKYALITTGKKHDITVGRGMRFERGTIVVFDQGYTDLAWWKQLGEQGVYFVSRLHADLKFTVRKQRAIPPTHTHLRSDQEIDLPGHRQVGKEGLSGLRRIEIWIEEKQELLVLVTNHPTLAASTIAEIYRKRWEIETFFKSLKQLLKIKTFVGTSESAVLTQIWTALIVMLVLRWLKMKSRYAWSLSNLLALLRQQLFVHRDLWTWLNDPFQAPPGLPQTEQLSFLPAAELRIGTA